MRGSRIPIWLGLHLLMVCFAGCAFERQWQSARQFNSLEYELAGCWEGTWQSQVNHRQGSIRAIITRQGQNCYHAHFRTSCVSVIPVEFEMPLYVSDEGAVYSFEGEQDLGRLAGGVFVCSGRASGCELSAEYLSDRGDSGRLTLTRVCESGDCGNSRSQPAESPHAAAILLLEEGLLQDESEPLILPASGIQPE